MKYIQSNNGKVIPEFGTRDEKAGLLATFIGILAVFSVLPTWAIIAVGGYMIINLIGKILLNKVLFVPTLNTGKSMYPAMPDGISLIFIYHPLKLKEGDVVSIEPQYGSTNITHRVIDIDGDTITTKGDNNDTADRPVKRNDVAGKCVTFGKNPIYIPLSPKALNQTLW